jgi:hypothetical protein
MELKQRILNEMVEKPVDKLVRELRGCKGFDESYIRARYSQFTRNSKLKNGGKD